MDKSTREHRKLGNARSKTWFVMLGVAIASVATASAGQERGIQGVTDGEIVRPVPSRPGTTAGIPFFMGARTGVPVPARGKPTDLPAVATWEVQVNPSVANLLRRQERMRPPAATRQLIEMELEPGVMLKTELALRTVRGSTHVTAGGGLADDHLVALVSSPEGTSGTVWTGGKLYKLSPSAGGKTLVTRVEPSAFPDEADPLPIPPRGGGTLPPRRDTGTVPGTSPGIFSLTAGPHVHRLLVVYTDDVAARPGAVNEIESAIDLANMTYENSGIELRLELAAAVPVDYDESHDTGTDLGRLQSTSDGHLDEVHAIRDRVAADLVALVVDDAGDACGQANLAVISSDADDDSAFAVVDFSCFSNSSLTHELGHIAGAHHNTGHDPTPLPAYAHGWTKDDQFSPTQGWRSTMAYNTGGCSNDTGNCPRFPMMFSNPDKVIGTQAGGGPRSNNARRVGETAQTLANFRIDGPRVSLYEGNDGTQDHVCVVDIDHDAATVFNTLPNPRRCDNDEARSARLFDVSAGRTLRLYDSPAGERQDDWVEITVKRDAAEVLIPSFERSFENDDVRVVYHRNNGLDGKVSRLESSLGGSGPRMALYEGNSASQNLVCVINVGQTATVRFQGHPECDNDEARSAVLVDVPAGTVIRLYDSPTGAREDDWVELVVEGAASEVRISSFELSARHGGAVRAIYHRNNGLDGKVSLVEVDTAGGATGPLVTLKEGNRGTQNTVCELGVAQAKQVRFPGHPECDNDEARSLILHDVPAGTTLLLFDSPDRSLQDDWTAIRTKRHVLSRVIDSFEASFQDADVDVLHAHNNGLDGKVSRLEVSLGGDLGGVVTLHEGNNASQNKVCDLRLRNGETRFRGHGDCDNDEARSMTLALARAGTVVSVFDSPDCRTNDDFTVIRVKRDLFRKVIRSFETSTEDADVEVDHHHDNGLDGKVSCLRIQMP